VKRTAAIAVATSASIALGLTAALMVPLPVGLVAKDKDGGSNLWQVGLGYHVGRPVNILLMGIDLAAGAKPDTSDSFDGNSDTMLLLRVDPVADQVSLLSIPRDTQVELPGMGTSKINAANAEGGPKLAAQTVSATLNGVQIDRYVRVSTAAFRELVDLLGGVEVYVPKRMQYEDKTQKLKIDLSPGLQTLSGAQAEQFARFRHDDLGDIGRVQRQQALLKALRQKLTSPTVIPRIPLLLQTMQKYIDTNLSMEEMLALVSAGRKLAEGGVKMVMLPGRFSSPDEYRASYWIMDPTGRDRVMKQYFGVEPVDFTAITEEPAATSLKIAIQNASDYPNAPDQLRETLAKLGFTNVYISSELSDRQSQTEVIPQRGDLVAAENLQQALGLGKVQADSTGDVESDITIQVGNDWGNRP
jgi:polyisoprenyl-teichoic acid--peptidoglycan teichoic acid transferase